MLEMTRKQLLELPRRKWDERIVANGIYVIPLNKKHGSGWRCMNFVAETEKGYVLCGGYCDDISFEGEHFRMDCDPYTKLLHIWNRNKFEISEDLSSVYLRELKGNV